MNTNKLKKLLVQLTEDEKKLINQSTETFSPLVIDKNAYKFENDIYVFLESALSEAPVSIPGYEHTSKHFNFLNIVVNKHTRLSEVPMHRHEFVEMNYVLSGNISFIVNGKELTMEKGNIGIMDSNVVHQVLKTGEKDIMLNIMMPKYYFDTAFMMSMMGVELATKFFRDVISDKTEHDQYLIMNPQNSKTIEKLFLNIFCEFLEPKLGSANMIRYYISIILIESMRSYNETYFSQHTEYGEKDDILQILQYIDENCTNCTLQDVADYFNYSVNHLSRKIKSAVGKSFQQYISEQRLNMVALQLSNTDLTITSIAANCGYNNMTFFYKKFEEKFNMTPKAYRDKLRETYLM